jgi:hypothetical protein
MRSDEGIENAVKDGIALFRSAFTPETKIRTRLSRTIIRHFGTVNQETPTGPCSRRCSRLVPRCHALRGFDVSVVAVFSV